MKELVTYCIAWTVAASVSAQSIPPANLNINGTASQIERGEGVKEINGTKLFVKVFGKGEPLMIVHGGPGLNHTYFLPHLKSLARFYTVILYDQRASGRSVIPSIDSLSLKFFVDDIEAIRIKLGYEKMNILGHSWGAIPVVGYGIKYPERVRTIVLCNPVPMNQEFESEISATMKKRRTSTDSIDRARIVSSDEFKSGKIGAYQKLILLSFRHAFSRNENISKLNVELPENYLKARKALFTGLGKEFNQYDYYDEIRKFNFPVLIMHGSSDFIPLQASQKTQSSIPDSRLVFFENSGHFIFIEEPKKFRKVLATMFTGSMPTTKK